MKNICNNYIRLPRNLIDIVQHSEIKNKILNLIFECPNKYGIFNIDYFNHKEAVDLLVSIKIAKFYPKSSILWIKYWYEPESNKKRPSTIKHTTDWLEQNAPEVSKDFIRYYELNIPSEPDDIQQPITGQILKVTTQDEFVLTPYVKPENEIALVISHYSALYIGRFDKKYPEKFNVEAKLISNHLKKGKTVDEINQCLTFMFNKSKNKWLIDKLGIPRVILSENVFISAYTEMLRYTEPEEKYDIVE